MLIEKKKRTLWLSNCSWLVMSEELNSWGTHQSAILVISLSGWFPTMWSINWRFGLGLQSQETVLHHHILKKLVSQQYINSEVYTLSLSLFNFYEIQRSFIKLWAHFVPPNKKLTISNNSEKVFISLWTNIAYWISLLEYIVRTTVQQGGLWMLKPCIQVGTSLCIQTGQSVCVLCLRMSLS